MTSGADVLVVDDDPAVRQVIASMLELDGHVVRAACDGRDALAQCDERTPALMVLDLAMPRLDGYGVLRALAAQEPARFPVLVATARRGECERAVAAGADDCIEKPLDMDDLLARVARLLARSVGSSRA